MPNHILNEIRIKRTSAADLVGVAINKDGFVDFKLLLPIPLNYWQGDEGLEHRSAFPGLGMKWATENWGTKWNAYGQGDNEHYSNVVTDAEDVVLTFQTAWAFPRGWITALFNTLLTDIECLWMDEGQSGAFQEKFIVKGRCEGLDWSVQEFEEGSPEQRRIHRLMWGVEQFDDDSVIEI